MLIKFRFPNGTFTPKSLPKNAKILLFHEKYTKTCRNPFVLKKSLCPFQMSEILLVLSFALWSLPWVPEPKNNKKKLRLWYPGYMVLHSFAFFHAPHTKFGLASGNRIATGTSFTPMAAPRGTGGIRPPILKSRQKLSMKNGIKLVGYTFRLKNYVKIPPPPPFVSDFSELAPPLTFTLFLIQNVFVPALCRTDLSLEQCNFPRKRNNPFRDQSCRTMCQKLTG